MEFSYYCIGSETNVNVDNSRDDIKIESLTIYAPALLLATSNSIDGGGLSWY